MPAQFFGTLPQQRPWIAEAAGGFGQGAMAGMQARQMAQQEAKKNSLMGQQLGMSGVAQALKQKQFEYKTGPQADTNEETARQSMNKLGIERLVALPKASRPKTFSDWVTAKVLNFKSPQESQATFNYVMNVPEQRKYFGTPEGIKGLKHGEGGEAEVFNVPGGEKRSTPSYAKQKTSVPSRRPDLWTKAIKESDPSLVESTGIMGWGAGKIKDPSIIDFGKGAHLSHLVRQQMGTSPEIFIQENPKFATSLNYEARVKFVRNLGAVLNKPEYDALRTVMIQKVSKEKPKDKWAERGNTIILNTLIEEFFKENKRIPTKAEFEAIVEEKLKNG